MGKRESRYVTDLGKEIRDLMILIILMIPIIDWIRF